MKILSLDQSLYLTGWALSGDPIRYDLIKTPYKLKGEAAADWQIESVRQLLDQHYPTHLSLEGIHVRQNVATAILLAEFRGRLVQLAKDRQIGVVSVSSHEVQEWLGLGAYARRNVKKRRAQVWVYLDLHPDMALAQPDDYLSEDISDAIVNLRIAEHKLDQDQLLREATEGNAPA